MLCMTTKISKIPGSEDMMDVGGMIKTEHPRGRQGEILITVHEMRKCDTHTHTHTAVVFCRHSPLSPLTAHMLNKDRQ